MDSRTMRWGVGLLFAASSVAAAAKAPDASALAWLAGAWSGTKDGVRSEEHWTSPEGGALVGMHKDVRDGKVVAFEFARIAVEAGKLCYLASPGGAAPTPFCAIEVGERRVVFENREHDFPQRVLYWMDGERIHARIEGTMNGEAMSEEWVWSRAQP